MEKWKPRDVITLVLLVGAFVLRGLGINSATEYVIIAVSVGYLGLTIPKVVSKLRK